MGDYTLREAMLLTHQYVPNRYTFKERDVVKKIIVKEIKSVNRHDLPGQPRAYTKYTIESKSYPQYPPYFSPRNNNGRSYQRSVSHKYDVIFEADTLSLNTTEWKMRLGSGRIWNSHPPQAMIKSLYRQNRLSWSPQKKREHRRKAKYLDIGDYNSREKGINADFIFRQSYARFTHGHLFGRNYYGNIPSRLNPTNIVFLTKHEINFIEILMRRGILLND